MALAYTGHLDGDALQQPMRAERHQVVHQVVAFGDGRKHAGDAPVLLARGALLEAELDPSQPALRFWCHSMSPLLNQRTGRHCPTGMAGKRLAFASLSSVRYCCQYFA